MSYSIINNTITLTRGDSLIVSIAINTSEGEPYIPTAEDTIRFAMKKDISDIRPIITKNIPTDTMLLVLDSIDTKRLDFGDYVYDIQLTKSNGEVDTFITASKLTLTEEVD